MLFRMFLAIDLIVVTVAVYFFFVGLEDGSITSFNMRLWLFTLVALGCVLFGGFALRNRGWTRSATTLLAILALPAIGYGIFMLSLILTVDRWN